MTDPIPIHKDRPQMTAEEYMKVAAQKHQQRLQWVFMAVLAVVVLAFVVPLGVFLTRLASGG